MKVTVGIKALNEEKHIADAIRSSLTALQTFNGEVILADSGSSDQTINIAKAFPIKIVQLANPEERRCGAGAQLAFQHVDADYFYLLDGDMSLDENFLVEGVRFLEASRDFAAVGGRVIERNLEAAEFQIRSDKLSQEAHWKPGVVDRLDCGGLYRVSAVKEAGYFADRNLHAFEEFELAARLRTRGWKLARIDHPAVDHFGHSKGSYQLLWRRLTSGYLGGVGEVLRGAIGKAHLRTVLKLSHVRVAMVVCFWWLLVVVGFVTHPILGIGLLLGPISFLVLRRRSIALGIFSFASWNAVTVGAIAGFFGKRFSPKKRISSVELQTPGNSGSHGEPYGQEPRAVQQC